jgi:hypothetical protein
VKGLLEGLRDRDRQLQRERALSQERLQIITNQTAALKNEDLRTFEFLKSLAKLTGEDPWLIERNWKFTPDDLCRKLENLLRQRDEEIQSLKNQNQDLASSLASFEKWQQSWARRAFGRWHRFPNDHQKGPGNDRRKCQKIPHQPSSWMQVE